MTKQTVGFIGLGYMGQGMAANILAKGHPLVCMAHRNRAPLEALVAKGAREAKTPREMAAECDVIVLCVTGSPEVLAIVEGPDGNLYIATEGATGGNTADGMILRIEPAN